MALYTYRVLTILATLYVLIYAPSKAYLPFILIVKFVAGYFIILHSCYMYLYLIKSTTKLILLSQVKDLLKMRKLCWTFNLPCLIWDKIWTFCNSRREILDPLMSEDRMICNENFLQGYIIKYTVYIVSN